jgi:hypothetical protein
MMVKPFREYSDGHWLLLLWGMIVFVLLVGLFFSSAVIIVLSLLAGAGAGYTTYLYIQQLSGGPRSGSPASDADRHEGGAP